MSEYGEPWAWRCKLDDSWIGQPFPTEREAAAQISDFEEEGYSGVTVVPLYPLPNALRGLDPAAVARVVEAAECLSKADSELSVICHGRLPRSLEELKKVYPMFRSAYEDLRSALVALKESTTERKEEAPPSAAAVSAAAAALAAAAHVPGPPSPPLRCRRCGHSRERHRRADHGCLDCDCGQLQTGEVS